MTTTYSREWPLSILAFFSAMGLGAGHIRERRHFVTATTQLKQQPITSENYRDRRQKNIYHHGNSTMIDSTTKAMWKNMAGNGFHGNEPCAEITKMARKFRGFF